MGTPHSAARASCMQPGDGWGQPDQATRYPSAQTGDGGGGGAPPNQQRALPVHDLPEREKEGGIPHKQEGEGMALPEQHSALPAQGTREREGGGTPLTGEERRGGRRESIQTGKRTQGRADGTRKRRRRTAPIRGEEGARGAGAEYSL